ncbi:Uncharacterised protein [uncultured archaeon]|nr:Uncharacterised protein [uncultured archaeon]
MKVNYLAFWIAVIFSISCSFAQLIDISNTPTQGAFQAGAFQTTPVTTSPSQQAYEIGSTQTALGPQATSERANQSGKNQTTSEIQTSGLPSVTITSPTEGVMIPAGNVTVTADVENFKLVNKLGQMDVAGEGHLYYFIDVPVPTSPGKLATSGVGKFVPAPDTSWTWPNVAPGLHNFSVQLANNDHSSVIPLVYATVNVTVTAPT